MAVAGVRRIGTGASARYEVASLDDRCNVLGPSSLADRFAVLSGIADAVPRLMDPAVAKTRRRAFVNWASLAMLTELRKQTHTGWGSGTFGYAEPATRKADPSTPRQERRRASKSPARAPRLMLNLLDPDLVLPEFRSLNIAREVASLQAELLDIVFNEEVRIPSAALHGAVQRALSDGPMAALVHTVLPAGASWTRPHGRPSQGPSLARAIPQILAYYGAGRPGRLEDQRLTAVIPWRLHLVLDRIAKERTLDLGSLPWMDGRYLVRPALDK